MRLFISPTFLLTLFTLIETSASAQIPNLRGVWHNKNDSRMPCIIRQDGNNVTMIDENGESAEGTIQGDRLTLTTYSGNSTTLWATIQNDASQLVWLGDPNSIWHRKNRYAEGDIAVELVTLRCDKLEDAKTGPKDEIYFIVTGRRSDGMVFAYRYPSDGHFSLHPDEERRGKNIYNTMLWGGNVPKGGWIDVTLTVMEEDEGRNAAINKALVELQKALTAEAKRCQEQQKAQQNNSEQNDSCEFIQTAKVVVDVLNLIRPTILIKNDELGTLALRVSRDGNGNLNTNWHPLNHIKKIENPQDPNIQLFKADGDGSDYALYMYVTGK